MISGETIVCFAPDPWDDIWRNRHQIMTRLARQNRAVYVEPRQYLREAMRESTPGSGRARWQAGFRPAMDGLWVYRPPRWAPIVGRWPLSTVARAFRTGSLKRVLAGLGGGRPIVWLFRPDQDDVPGTLAEKLLVYHIVDEYSGYAGIEPSRRAEVQARERRLMARADLVFVTSPMLLAAKNGVNPRTVLVPNGVDAAAFAQAVERGHVPADLAAIPTPRIGYVGAINEKIDFALLRDLAVAHPEWNLVLVGPWVVKEDRDAQACRALANVHHLGVRPVSEVPDYVVGMQVCLLPYKLNEWTRHIDPLKLYEYLAAGKPIVATPIPGVQPYAELLTVRGAGDFGQGVVSALEETGHGRARERQRAAAQNTWDARVEALSAHIAAALAARQT